MEKKQSSSNFEKHIIKCPSCGKDILDHMSKCPYCESELPTSYREMSPKTKKTVKIVLWVLLGILAVTVIILKGLDII
jgi:ribosomal protein L32